jgi:diguanylate cyclase (GGDEF)-like protein/PAS domain S-box-containing protein
LDRVTVILWASVAVQGLAGVLALRLIPVSGRALAWILLSLAFLLMMTRRTLSLLQQQGVVETPWLSATAIELVALLISVLMLLGVRQIRNIFRERQRAESELRKVFGAIEHSPIATVITDASGTIEYVNPRFTQVTGYRSDEAVGANPRLLKSGETSPESYRDLWDTITNGREWRGELRNRRKNGELYWESATIAPVMDGAGAISHYVATLEDITQRRAQAEALEYQATHDALTDLPNRTLCYDRIRQVIASSRRRDEHFAVIVMDLDGFKDINDTLGHHHGDRILREVGERLQQPLRDSDTVSRLGGDEFAVLLPDTDPHQALNVVHKLSAALRPSFIVERHAVDVGASMGIVYYPDHGDDADTLLQRADVAMYVAKRARIGYAIYDADQDPNTLTRLTLMTDLRQAIDSGRLVLYYQPKFSLRSGQVSGVECLLRWPHPQHGFMPPDAFIPLAEQSAVIKPLSQWVLRTAAAQCRQWRTLGLNLSVAVNLSARDLEVPELPDIIAGLLDEHDIHSRCLMLELTENAIMSDPDRALDIISRLAAMGVRFSIDDFGTGYSSLANLKSLPVAELKIDKSFVMDMHSDDNDAIIVRSTIDLAHNLGLRVVAEGVESQEDWDLLAILGCDSAQGYHMCRPLPAEELSRWLLTADAVAGPPPP